MTMLNRAILLSILCICGLTQARAIDCGFGPKAPCIINDAQDKLTLCDKALQACDTLQKAQAEEIVALKEELQKAQDMAVKGSNMAVNDPTRLSFSGVGVGLGLVIAGPPGAIIGGLVGLIIGVEL